MNHARRNLDTLIAEAKKWGAPWRVDASHKHPRFYVAFNGEERFVTFSKTAVDPRANKNNVSHLRRILREMGA